MTTLPIDQIIVKDNVREDLGLDEMFIESIRQHGILVPVTLTSQHELIAGRRRYEAAKVVGLTEIPVFVMGETTGEMVVLQLVENVQRKGLNPIEEAYGFKALQESGLNQRDIGAQVGVNQATVSRRLRLLKLGPKVQKLVANGSLDEALAAEISQIEDINVQEELARDPQDWKITAAKGFQEREQLVAKFTKELGERAHQGPLPKGYVLHDVFASPSQLPTLDESAIVQVLSSSEDGVRVGVYLPGTATNENIRAKAERLARKAQDEQITAAVAKIKWPDMSTIAVKFLLERSLTEGVARKVATRLGLAAPENGSYVTLVTEYAEGSTKQLTIVAACVLVEVAGDLMGEHLTKAGVGDLGALTDAYLEELRTS